MPAAPLAPVQPRVQTFTTWFNPTDHDMVVDPWVGATPDNPSGRVRFMFPKGEKTIVPSEFDAAIHQVHNGQVIGGGAPLLQRVGGSDVLHEALDPNESAKKDALEAAQDALAKKKAAEEALVVAAKKIDDAEAAQKPSAEAPAAKPKK